MQNLRYFNCIRFRQTHQRVAPKMEPVCKFDSPAKPVKKIDKKLLGVEFFDTNL